MLVGGKESACRGCFDHRRGRRVPGVDADRQAVRAAFAIAHRELRKIHTRAGIQMRRGYCSGVRGSVVLEIPLVGKRIVIRVTAPTAVKLDGERKGSEGWVRSRGRHRVP